MQISFNNMFSKISSPTHHTKKNGVAGISRPNFGDSFEKNKTEQIDHIKKLFEMHNKEYAEILNEINSIETTYDIEKSITLRNSLLKRLSSVKNKYEIVNAMLSRSSDENKYRDAQIAYKFLYGHLFLFLLCMYSGVGNAR